MNTFVSIDPKQLSDNPFKLIGDDWMLITAEKDGSVNTMTASWGGFGVIWGIPAAYIFIRPQRYTKEFADSADKLSLSVLDGSKRSVLSYLGTVSGRDEQKITKAGLTVRTEDGAPFFDEARLVFICRKLFAQPVCENNFTDTNLVVKWYPEKDFHTMYVCQIEKILGREA